MLVANKSFQMRADESYARGETIPPEKWAALPRRTQDALKGARFVLVTDDAPSPPPASSAKARK